MSLVRRFPLRPIRNDAEHRRAVAVVEELLGTMLASGEGDYLDTLILLVNKYEDECHTPAGKLSPQAALRAIMEFNNLTQKEIGELIGSAPAVSMFLKGERELSKHHIKVLAERFRVNANLFL